MSHGALPTAENQPHPDGAGGQERGVHGGGDAERFLPHGCPRRHKHDSNCAFVFVYEQMLNGPEGGKKRSSIFGPSLLLVTHLPQLSSHDPRLRHDG